MSVVHNLSCLLVVLMLIGEECGSDGPPASSEGCADVIDVNVSRTGTGIYTFDVTVHSADTGWDKYADQWEVVAPDGSVLGSRILAHPHVDEQPFTRSQSGIVISEEISGVIVRARDSVEGFCGTVVEVAVPR